MTPIDWRMLHLIAALVMIVAACMPWPEHVRMVPHWARSLIDGALLVGVALNIAALITLT